MESALYTGTVRHRRFRPFDHRFRYRIFMLWLDLDEAEDLLTRGRWLSARRFAPLRFRRADHLGPAEQPLADAVRDEVQRQTGRRPEGPIRLLTLLRHFGFGFNPVSFYYCFSRAGDSVEAIVAEVNNTPWREQHVYVLSAPDHFPESDTLGRASSHALAFRFAKAFHVSPFMPLDQVYACRASNPGRRLTVHFENHDADGKVFDATLALRRRALTPLNLALTWFGAPFLSFKILAAIYFQALLLHLKGARYFPHPHRNHPRHESARPVEATER